MENEIHCVTGTCTCTCTILKQAALYMYMYMCVPYVHHTWNYGIYFHTLFDVTMVLSTMYNIHNPPHCARTMYMYV